MAKIISHKRAFTLIEVLVACAILIILITAVVELGVTIINGSVLSRQRVTAYYLAQEGIETIRQIRDSNLIDGNDQTNWNSLVSSSGSFEVPDLNGSTIYGVINLNNRFALDPRSAENIESITIDGVSYQRKITFIPAGISIPEFEQKTPVENQAMLDANAMRTVITVSWKYKNSSRDITVRELITNWKQLL